MPRRHHAESQRPRATTARRRAIVGFAALAVIVLVTAALRYGGGIALKHWLESIDEPSIAIESLDFNPFSGRISVTGARITAAERAPWVIPQARLRVALLPFFTGERRLTVHELTLTGTTLAITRRPDGVLELPGLPPPAPADAEPAERWRIELSRIQLRDSRVSYRDPAMQVTAIIERATIAAKGMTGARTPSWQVNAALTLRELTIDAAARETRLLQAATVTLDGLDVSAAQPLILRRLTIERLALLSTAGKPNGAAAVPPLRAQQVVAHELSFDHEAGIGVDRVTLSGVDVSLRRDRTRSWPVVTTWRQARPQAGAPTGAGPAWRLRALTIADDMRVRIEDEAVSPTYRASWVVDEARLANLDSARPSRTSAVTVRAALGKYTRLAVTGDWRPFAPHFTADLSIKLEDLDLPPLSPYLAETLGYRVDSGRLDAELRLRGERGRLDGESQLVLQNIRTSPAKPGQIEKLQQRLAMPLETALDALRDRNNDVRLELSLSGDTADPQFDLTDAVNQATAKALKSSALSYLKYYFQPYGTLITVAELAGKALQVRLDPVRFAPGSAVLDEHARAYLIRMAGFLEERPAARLRLCGLAVPADAQAGTRELGALATARAEATRDHLVQRHRIDAKRLFVCHPEISDKPEAEPRVNLAL